MQPMNQSMPQQPMQQAPMMQQPMANPNMQNQQMPSRGRGPWIILAIVVIVVLAALAFMFRDKWMPKNAAQLSGYQAVFLTNGQVYFGKLSDASDEYATLTDIYYLQVNQPLQSAGANGAAANQPQAQPQLSLVKLGNELHGPVDLMHISRTQILFYEDMKADGKVAQAIQDYKKNLANPQQQAAPSQQAPAPAPTTPAPVPTH